MNTIENVYILVEQQTCLHCNNGVSDAVIIVMIIGTISKPLHKGMNISGDYYDNDNDDDDSDYKVFVSLL